MKYKVNIWIDTDVESDILTVADDVYNWMIQNEIEKGWVLSLIDTGHVY